MTAPPPKLYRVTSSTLIAARGWDDAKRLAYDLIEDGSIDVEVERVHVTDVIESHLLHLLEVVPLGDADHFTGQEILDGRTGKPPEPPEGVASMSEWLEAGTHAVDRPLDADRNGVVAGWRHVTNGRAALRCETTESATGGADAQRIGGHIAEMLAITPTHEVSTAELGEVLRHDHSKHAVDLLGLAFEGRLLRAYVWAAARAAGAERFRVGLGKQRHTKLPPLLAFGEGWQACIMPLFLEDECEGSPYQTRARVPAVKLGAGS